MASPRTEDQHGTPQSNSKSMPSRPTKGTCFAIGIYCLFLALWLPIKIDSSNVFSPSLPWLGARLWLAGEGVFEGVVQKQRSQWDTIVVSG